MKKLFLVFAIVLAKLFVNAQPVLNAEDFPIEKNNMYTVKHAAGGIDPGSSGPNVLWDFSTVDSTNSYNHYATECMGLADCDSFPGSDFFNHEIISGTKHFYKKDNSVLQYLGYNVVEDMEKDSFNNPKNLLVFPLVYNGTFNDTYSSTRTFNDGSGTATNGTISGVVDAYGQITTPRGTYKNVLRVKTTIDDLITYFPIPNLNYPNNKAVIYDWYQAGIGHSVFQIFQFSAYGNNWPEIDVNLYYFITKEPVNITAIKDLFIPHQNISLFPNPSRSEFSIKAENFKIANISIISVTGIIVYENHLQPAQNDKSIVTSDWAKGIYFVAVNDGAGSSAVKKIVVE